MNPVRNHGQRFANNMQVEYYKKFANAGKRIEMSVSYF